MKSPQCPKCGSANTSSQDLSSSSPSWFYTFLIGWTYLLPRMAFVPRAWICPACGERFRRRTVGSYIALSVLVTLVLLIIIASVHSGLGD
jgi:F0F1-type ATP synthase assembly protein I